MKDYEAYDALGLAALVRKEVVSPEKLLEEAIARTEALDPELGAVVIPMFDEARATLARGLPEGPLRGVPFLLKDLHALYTGARTSYGARLFADFVADHDSEIVARYRRAGLVIFGKSASPEFGLTSTTESRLYGATRNPWDPTRSAGGSSGGSAAAVAAGILPAAHATDGGGSIRIPASCCGVFGLKPTRARVPYGPDLGEGWSGMSVAHAVTRSVRDSAALLDATAGPETGSPYQAPPPARPWLAEVGADPGRLRVALQTQAFNGVDVHRECIQAAQEAARLCEELGHDVEEAELAIDDAAFGEATRVIISANVRATLLDRARALGRELREDDVEPLTWLMVQDAAAHDSTAYARALRTIHALGRQVGKLLERFDVLLTPTLAAPPLPLGALAQTNPDQRELFASLRLTSAFVQLFNASGHPAMSVPLHWSVGGLPVGVQFVGRFGDEATLFRLAAQLEVARPWAERRPGVRPQARTP